MIADDVRLGKGVVIVLPDLVNLYGCTIGDGTRIGPFVEIQRGVTIGMNCKISSHTFICEGISIDDGVFIGHGVMFTNDLFPRAVNERGELLSAGEWELVPTKVGARASIGSNATIIAGAHIGAGSLIGAGSVVTKPVPEFAIAVGVPARVIGDVRQR